MMTQRERLEKAKSVLFPLLRAGEETLNINLVGETTTFIRFNKTLIRQSTDVEQCDLTLELKKGKQHSSMSFSFGASMTDEALAYNLKVLQDEVDQLPEDPYCAPHTNEGESVTEYKGELPTVETVLETIKKNFSDVDLAGQYVTGQLYRGNANSLGQSHWYSSESMYVDYSLYSAKEKAVKGSYASTHYNEADLITAIKESAEALKVMESESTVLKPGKYKVYLAPAALGEIAGMLGWHGLSGAAYKQGECPLGKAYEGKHNLSPLLNMNEDFSLGLTPRFNENGELADEKMEIVKDGKLVNLFVSKSTELEYGLKSNKASGGEGPRSLVIETGDLAREDILKELGTGIYLSNLHYLNWSDKAGARITGMTRFGCLYVEDGKIVGPIKDMRFDETLYQVFGDGLKAVTDFSEVEMSTGSYDNRNLGGTKLPGMIVEGFSFTL